MIKKIKYNAPVTLTFSLICLVVLALSFITNYRSTEALFVCYDSGWLNPLTYIRMITYCLGHANWEHFIGNISYILLLGPMLEEKYGSEKLLIMIVLSAFIGGLVNNIFFRNSGLIGASGVVFMMIVLSSVTSVKEGNIPLTLILVMLIYVGQEVYSAIAYRDSIAQFAHIVGGLCGGFFGLWLLKNNRD